MTTSALSPLQPIPMHPMVPRPGAWSWRCLRFASFVAFGIVYSFGVFLPPVMADLGSMPVVSKPPRGMRWAASSGISPGPSPDIVGDRFGPRFMAGAGAVAMGAGLALTACIEQLWVGYLIYGLGVGMGAACAYVPTLANLGGWFVKKRNTAFSIAAAGTGCGMLIVPPLSAKLIEMAGWQFANVVLGAGSFLLLAASALMLAPPPLAQQAPSGRPLRPVLCSFEFVMMYLSWVLATTALFVPFVFLPQFAVSQGADPVAASALISVLGAASVLGRLCAGMLGKWINNLTLFKGAVLFDGGQLYRVVDNAGVLVAGRVRDRSRHCLRNWHRPGAERADRVLRRPRPRHHSRHLLHGDWLCLDHRPHGGWLCGRHLRQLSVGDRLCSGDGNARVCSDRSIEQKSRQCRRGSKGPRAGSFQTELHARSIWSVNTRFLRRITST